jgi:hypothetical protein
MKAMDNKFTILSSNLLDRRDMVELTTEVKSLRIGQKEISSRLPDSIIAINLTPTNASVSTKESSYVEALGMLNIDTPIPSEDTYTCSLDSNNFIFEWIWGRKAEKDAYEPLCQELNLANYNCVIISEGEHLHNKNLFNESLWALRKKDHDNVLFIGNVHGRTDLVVLYSPFISNAYITRNMVKFGIEIKLHSAMDTNSGLKSCIREASTQLLGLNAGNINNSPSVILTDLTHMFFCIYLELIHPMPLKFSIKVHRCKNIASALYLAEQKGDFLQENMRPISYDFARRPTPPSSVSNDIDANDTNSDDLEGL